MLIANADQVGITEELAHANCAALHEPAQNLERCLALACGRNRGRGGQSDAASARRSQREQSEQGLMGHLTGYGG
jgi:hypothetical protein